MKRKIGLLLSFCMILSLVACGGNKGNSSQDTLDNNNGNSTREVSSNANETLVLGDTVSSDIVDLTVEKATLSFYASSGSENRYAPIDSDDGGYFRTNKGYTLVCMNFKVNNNDRGNLNLGSTSVGDWPVAWKVRYNGEEHELYSFDLNNLGGTYGLRFDFALIGESSSSLRGYDSINYIMDPGETIYVQTFGISNFEAENLSDEFELIVSIPSSTGEDIIGTYKIN